MYCKGIIKIQDRTEYQVVKLIFLVVFFVVFYSRNGKMFCLYLD